VCIRPACNEHCVEASFRNLGVTRKNAKAFLTEEELEVLVSDMVWTPEEKIDKLLWVLVFRLSIIGDGSIIHSRGNQTPTVLASCLNPPDA
jgi:hypothetical protein